MNVDALRHAGIGALANRGMQALVRVVDRASARRRGEPARPGAGLAPAARFFAGATVDPRGALGSAARDAIVAAADDVLAGRFTLLGYGKLEIGRRPDWFTDPVSGRRAPDGHWTQLDPLDYATLGDHKVTWELNRHQWFIDLGQAWRLTGDARYRDAFIAALDDWMDRNPPGIGINWASSLEAAYRAVSWCWALYLFDGAHRERAVGWLRAHAAHVERYLSYYYSPNTHLTGEALGLFTIGAALADGRDARRWRRTGARILIREAERQIHDDGIYFEQATCYQRYTLEIYLQFLILAARNGQPVPVAVAERVQKAFDALLHLMRADRRLPVIGDDDGGSILHAAGRATDDPRGLFAAAAAWFGRADYAWAAGGFQPEAFWLLGDDGRCAFDALDPAPPMTPPSRLYPRGGYAVMRTGWNDDAHRAVFDVGPLGCPVSGGHGHADLLSLNIDAYGTPVIADPGTGSYVPTPEWRERFRTTAAHATALVDGAPQAETDGPFRWQARPRARLRRWMSGPDYDLVDGVHDAYRRLDDPVTHRRRVLFVKRRAFWLVVDDFDGAAEHRIECRYPFVPGVRVSLPDDRGWADAALGDRRHLLVRAFSRDPADVRVDATSASPAYGVKTPTDTLVHAWRGRLPLRVVTLFAPVEDGDGPPLERWAADGDRYELIIKGTRVLVTDDDVRVDKEDD